GGNAISVQADMSSGVDVTRLFDTVRETFGRLDILVNNAGVAVFQMIEDLTEEAFQMIEDLTEEAFHKQFNLNVLGYLLAVREASKLLGQGA
ncbi:SDR family NAD(P)-dependent oxidoreductase, partial [Klebsiella pneumoniae]|uniref:SDR family NAD(P)-dependent oxidoreductase n=1 Tax=Klebsiella pneumoniae TaxID=573 RepID=UPI00272FD0D8